MPNTENLTYEECLILAKLATGPLAYSARLSERTITHMGFVERCDVGQMRITKAGLNWLSAHGYPR